jgi:hypothetical protein
MILLQHDIFNSLGRIDSGKKQIGQSPLWLHSGCLNKISSRNSAALFLHARLCFGQCSCWHLLLQYRTSLQALHVFNLLPFSATPHAVQHIIMPSSASKSID